MGLLPSWLLLGRVWGGGGAWNILEFPNMRLLLGCFKVGLDGELGRLDGSRLAPDLHLAAFPRPGKSSAGAQIYGHARGLRCDHCFLGKITSLPLLVDCKLWQVILVSNKSGFVQSDPIRK